MIFNLISEMSSQMSIEEYSEKSFVVRGSTKKYKDVLLGRGGKWNPFIKNGGAGWIFSKRHHDKMKVFVDEVNSGKVILFIGFYS